MTVRRLADAAIQPKSFAFTIENLDWREIAKYPEGQHAAHVPGPRMFVMCHCTDARTHAPAVIVARPSVASSSTLHEFTHTDWLGTTEQRSRSSLAA